MFFLTIS